MARTRILDIDSAIETATQLFWRNGYERTSLSDLTQAMGITPPSFYFAFGNKEGLFKQVLARYSQTRLGYAEQALALPKVRDGVETMLSRLAALYSDPDYPPGCLALNNALPCVKSNEPMREEFAEMRAARRARLCARLEQAKAEGDLPANEICESLARYIMTVGWGMAIDAQSGATREDLLRTVANTMKAWPV